MQKLSVLLYLKLKVQCFEEACLAGYITQQAALPSHSSRSTTRSTLLDCTYMFSMPVPTSRPLPHAILPCTPLPRFLSVFNTILSLGSLSCFLSPCTCTVPVLCTYVPLYTYCTCTVYLCPPVHILYLYCVRMYVCPPVCACTHVLSSNPKLVCLSQADVRIREGIDFPATLRKCVRCEVDTFVGLILDPPSE